MVAPSRLFPRLLLIGVSVSMSLVSEPSLAGSDPASAAAEVHARGGYPSELPRDIRFRSAPCDLSDPDCVEAPEVEPCDAGESDCGARSQPNESDTVPKDTPRESAPLPPPAPASPVVTSGLPVVLILALVALLVAALWRLRGVRMPSRAPEPEPGEGPIPDAQGVEVPSELAALLASARYDQAVYVLFLLACGQLGELPHVRDRSKTAREILAGVAFADPRRAPFRKIVEVAERVRFAGHRATIDDVNAASNALEQLRMVGAG